MKDWSSIVSSLDFIPMKLGNHRTFQVWELYKPIYSFKGHSGNCGECIIKVRVETERGLGKES